MSSADDLLRFIDGSPTPFHVCRDRCRRTLDEAGFARLDEREAWPAERGRALRRPGRVARRVALRTATRRPVPHRRRPHRQPQSAAQAAPRHRGDPTGRRRRRRARAVRRGDARLLVRPRPRRRRTPRAPRRQRPARPHRRAGPARAAPGDPLDRDRRASDLDPQRHLNAVWVGSDPRVPPWLVASARASTPADVLGFELMAHDLQPSALVGADGELVSAPAAGQPGHLLRRAAGVPPLPSRPTASSRCWPCSTTRRSAAPVRARRAVRPARHRPRTHRARPPAADARTTTARSRRRCARPATWRTRRIPTTRSGTSRCTTSRWAGDRCSRSTRTCVTRPRRAARRRSRCACEQAERSAAALRAPRRPAVRLDDRPAERRAHRA